MRLCFLIGTCCFLATLAHAQTPPLPPGIPLTTATVSVMVNYDPGKDIFTYSYSLSNSKQSVGKIDSFYLDISTISGGAALGSSGLINSATGYSGLGTMGTLPGKVANATVTVGFESQPTGWDSGPTAQLTAGWFPGPHGDYINPGQSLSGFVLTSHGLPGVRHFSAEPAYDPDDFISGGIDDPPANMTAQQVVDLDNAIQRAIKSQGVTIGPVSPPSTTDAGSLVGWLASLKHQAADLGWIFGPGADGIVQSLDAKLAAASASIASGDSKTAANQLSAFINEVQAQRGKHVNDDACYLLTANAQYILTRLGP